jgi:hypothetical protein
LLGRPWWLRTLCCRRRSTAATRHSAKYPKLPIRFRKFCVYEPADSPVKQSSKRRSSATRSRRNVAAIYIFPSTHLFAADATSVRITFVWSCGFGPLLLDRIFSRRQTLLCRLVDKELAADTAGGICVREVPTEAAERRRTEASSSSSSSSWSSFNL